MRLFVSPVFSLSLSGCVCIFLSLSLFLYDSQVSISSFFQFHFFPFFSTTKSKSSTKRKQYAFGLVLFVGRACKWHAKQKKMSFIWAFLSKNVTHCMCVCVFIFDDFYCYCWIDRITFNILTLSNNFAYHWCAKRCG